MKAIIYTRVSSTAQSREDRVSLDEQARACDEYAAQRGYEVLDVVREVESAATVRGRPLLLDAMYRVRNKEATVLLAHCLDRLTREQAGMFVIDEEVRRGNGRVEFATEEFEDTAVGRFTRSARAFAAEVELERISARSAMGRAGRIAKKQLLVSGYSLFGYEYAGEKKERYRINPEQTAIVQRVFAEFVGGKSISRIAADLNEMGVPTSTGIGQWHKPTVWNILRNRSYTGEARIMQRQYGRDENGKQTKTYRPEEETVLLSEGTIPAIVDRLTFDRAQERLERNKAELARPTDSTEALLRAGFVFCGACGYRMVINRDGARSIYYRCQTGIRHPEKCRVHSIVVRSLDLAVWSRIEKVLQDPERLRAILAVPTRNLAGEITAIEQRIEELKREEAGLVRLAARLEEGDDAAESLLAQVRDAAQRRRVLGETRERLTVEAEDAGSRARRVDVTIEAVAGLSERVAALDYHEKRQAMADLGVKVAVYPKGHESGEHWVMVAMWHEEGRTKLAFAGEPREPSVRPYNCAGAAPGAGHGTTRRSRFGRWGRRGRIAAFAVLECLAGIDARRRIFLLVLVLFLLPFALSPLVLDVVLSGVTTAACFAATTSLGLLLHKRGKQPDQGKSGQETQQTAPRARGEPCASKLIELPPVHAVLRGGDLCSAATALFVSRQYSSVYSARERGVRKYARRPKSQCVRRGIAGRSPTGGACRRMNQAAGMTMPAAWLETGTTP